MLASMVTLRHDTTMWNEGFEYARNPYAVFLTNNDTWANSLPDYVNCPNTQWEGFHVDVIKIEVDQKLWDKQQHFRDCLYGSTTECDLRYPMTILSGPDVDLNNLLNAGIDLWKGV